MHSDRVGLEQEGEALRGRPRRIRAARSARASWASSVSRMTSRWQATSRGSSGSLSCSKTSSVGTSSPSPVVRLELVVPPLDEQLPARRTQRLDEWGRGCVVERSRPVGAKIAGLVAPATASPVAQATRPVAASGSSEPESSRARSTRSSGASSRRRRRRRAGRVVGVPGAHTHAGRRRPEPKVSRRWRRRGSGAGSASRRASDWRRAGRSPRRRRPGGRTAEQTWVPQIWEPASFRRPGCGVDITTSFLLAARVGIALVVGPDARGVGDRRQRLFDDADDHHPPGGAAQGRRARPVRGRRWRRRS